MTALAWAVGRLGSSLIEADEAAHYVNALMVGDWIRAGMPSPMAYATGYYAHFPRVTIGHWPPAWYALEAPFFALFHPAPRTVVIAMTLIGGCNAALVDWALRRAGHPRAALAAALGYLLLPIVIDQGGYALIDQPLALCAGIAAILWWRATCRPGLARYLLFALAAATTMMIKGNGVLIVAMPLFHIALTGRWSMLADWRLWLAALFGLALVLPWYWLTFGIAAGGFNYEAGPAFAALALRFVWVELAHNITPIGIAAALAGILIAARRRRENPAEWDMAALATAMICACLLILAAIPVALVPRYLMPMIPWLVVLVTLAIVRLWLSPPLTARAAAITAMVVVAANALWFDTQLHPKPDIDADAIVARIATRPGLWMIDGRGTGEGGVIATAAYRDDGAMRSWMLRSSQWLARSNFMGSDYVALVHSPADTRAILDRLGVVGVVSILERDKFGYPHSPLLVGSFAEGFIVERHRFRSGHGHYLIAIRRGAVTPHPELLETRSSNLARISGGG